VEQLAAAVSVVVVATPVSERRSQRRGDDVGGAGRSRRLGGQNRRHHRFGRLLTPLLRSVRTRSASRVTRYARAVIAIQRPEVSSDIPTDGATRRPAPKGDKTFDTAKVLCREYRYTREGMRSLLVRRKELVQ